MSRKKDLYLSKSKTLAELNKLVENATTTTRVGNVSAHLLLNCINNLLPEAEKSFLDGDEELAYVMYMRCMELVSSIKRAPDYENNKKYLQRIMGAKMIEGVMDKCKKLVDSLKSRYGNQKNDFAANFATLVSIKSFPDSEDDATPTSPTETLTNLDSKPSNLVRYKYLNKMPNSTSSLTHISKTSSTGNAKHKLINLKSGENTEIKDEAGAGNIPDMEKLRHERRNIHPIPIPAQVMRQMKNPNLKILVLEEELKLLELESQKKQQEQFKWRKLALLIELEMTKQKQKQN